MEPPAIVVVGSLNVDFTYRVPRLPRPGETVTATGVFECFGGKGANQAIAAARAGGRVAMIGCVGEDDAGARYLAHLQREGIDTSGLRRVAAPTGSALITVDDRGENSIVVNPGANHALTPADLDANAALIRDARALVMQLECPLATVLRAAEIAAEADTRVFLNPSPWLDELARIKFPARAVWIVNEQEASFVAGVAMANDRHDLDLARARAGAELLVVTRGARSTIAVSLAERWECPPPQVEPVDTVGAGDSFAGALAVALTEGRPVAHALLFANAAGALATLKPGAQTAIPTRDEIETASGQ